MSTPLQDLLTKTEAETITWTARSIRGFPAFVATFESVTVRMSLQAYAPEIEVYDTGISDWVIVYPADGEGNGPDLDALWNWLMANEWPASNTTTLRSNLNTAIENAS